MTVLRFALDAEPARLRHWGFAVVAAEFAVPAAAVLALSAAQSAAQLGRAARRRLTIAHRANRRRKPTGKQRAAEAEGDAAFEAGAAAEVERHARLVEAITAGRPASDDVRWLASGLILDCRFASVHCGPCGRDYGPESCAVIPWGVGERLFAEGGRRLDCPAGHTMFAEMEWNS